MKKLNWPKWVSLFLVAAMLVGSVPELAVSAANSDVMQVETTDVSGGDAVSGNDVVFEEHASVNMFEKNVDASGNDAGANAEAPDEDVSGNDTNAEIPESDVSGNATDAKLPETPEGDISGNDADTNAEMPESDVSGNDTGVEMSESDISGNDADAEKDEEQRYQYLTFGEYGEDIIFSIPNEDYVTPVEGMAEAIIYAVEASELEELVFEATVRVGDKLEIPESLQDIVYGKAERVFNAGRWVYAYGLKLSALETTETTPICVELTMSHESVSVQIDGKANISGIDEYGYAIIGEEVSIEVVEPGCVLVKHTQDEKANDVYTAMELDYDNCYVFEAVEAVQFYVVDPEQVDYAILNSSSNKAKVLGVNGLKLTGLASSAQGYNEIVLNFTAVKNGTDGTETENVYYEVKVTAIAKEGESLPAGSCTTPKYYYIPKVANNNTQSKSIKVNDGVLSAPTAATYEFSARMVMIDKSASVPDEDTALDAPLTVNLTNNTITKQFKTKNPYFEDKLGFTKKNTKIYNGQENVLAGIVKYSKNASYLHDLTAVVYDSRGAVCEDIICTFKNDNDELYISTEEWTTPGKYKVVIYASIGEAETADSPQGGTMYQANTSFALTVQECISYIDTDDILDEVGVNTKNVTISVAPVGYTYYTYKKAAKQKFTYELKSVTFADDGSYELIDPVEKVADSISVNSKGKLTIKRNYYVDEDITKNYIAVVIKAADYAGNPTKVTKLIQIVSTVSIPTTIYLADSNGYQLGTSLYAYQADGAQVIVLDQYGNNMNDKVTITPADNKSATSAAYVCQYDYNDKAYLYVRKPTTVTIKAVTKDGTKKSKTLKVKISKMSLSRYSTMYYNINRYNISCNGITASSMSDDDDGNITYNALKGATIRFRLGGKYDGYVEYDRDWYDWGYKVTGGKLKFDGNYWVLTPTAQTAYLSVWSKSNPNATWEYSFTNSNWSTTYDAAPKLKLESGKLYSNKYTNDADLEVYEDEYDTYYYVPNQQLTYSYAYGSYDDVRISKISNSGPYLYVSDLNPEKRTFKLNASPGTDIKTGSFKYVITFYRDGVLMCKPTTITVKVNKAPQLKVTASYTLNSANTDYVALKCSTKDFTPDFETKVLNANVKGKANDFAKYFELVYVTDATTGKETPVIRFKSTVTAEEKAQLKGKTLTGYVKYSYYYGYSYIENVTSKISIKVK